jgi:hypothetical protein
LQVTSQGHRPCTSINGAGVESIQAKWDEMFGEKTSPEQSRMEEEVAEEVKAKKPRKKEKEAEPKKRTIKRKTSVKKAKEENIETKS